ncbi:uncharacterized protein LOC108628938 [Ceratina calcarata]|uniref:Uncharacterized protein LOC108628938 n=1 Tax=Ceratina calcarata TaxID=156304 RepID=A0AAJ7J8B4_9HYME|nr:uncharacterized protein LOC108628938 [Ceratina calcarata]
MSKSVKSWTDLPDRMKPDFVSYEGNYDFPSYLPTSEECVNSKEEKKEEIDEETDEYKLGRNEPFLIMELNRLVPFTEDSLIKFHPLNMPHEKIGVIEIAGFVLDINETDNFYQYTVDDGTGIITVYYRKSIKSEIDEERRKIDEKYFQHLSRGKIDVEVLETDICPDKFSEPRPGFKYPVGTRTEDALIFEHNWSLDTENGTRGKPIKCCTYICAKGELKFFSDKKQEKKITFHDLSNSQIIFMAKEVSGLTEHQYNSKVLSWVKINVQKRYNKGPFETFTDAQVPIFDMII